MNIHDATEAAYKNGYDKAVEDIIKYAEKCKEKHRAADTDKWIDAYCAIRCPKCGEEYNEEIFCMRGRIKLCPNCGTTLEEEQE